MFVVVVTAAVVVTVVVMMVVVVEAVLRPAAELNCRRNSGVVKLTTITADCIPELASPMPKIDNCGTACGISFSY